MTLIQARTAGPAETRALAERLAPLLRVGDVILLGGGLGAGKTTFTQGLAEALGVEDVVTSPTFTLVRSYPTRAGWDLIHADVYRLEQLQEVIDLALPEEVEGRGCAVIEWGERAAPALGPEYLLISVDYGQGTTERVFRFQPVGEAWADRSGAIAEAVAGAGQP